MVSNVAKQFITYTEGRTRISMASATCIVDPTDDTEQEGHTTDSTGSRSFCH